MSFESDLEQAMLESLPTFSQENSRDVEQFLLNEGDLTRRDLELMTPEEQEILRVVLEESRMSARKEDDLRRDEALALRIEAELNAEEASPNAGGLPVAPEDVADALRRTEKYEEERSRLNEEVLNMDPHELANFLAVLEASRNPEPRILPVMERSWMGADEPVPEYLLRESREAEERRQASVERRRLVEERRRAACERAMREDALARVERSLPGIGRRGRVSRASDVGIHPPPPSFIPRSPDAPYPLDVRRRLPRADSHIFGNEDRTQLPPSYFDDGF
jgi:hypothetical protein